MNIFIYTIINLSIWEELSTGVLIKLSKGIQKTKQVKKIIAGQYILYYRYITKYLISRYDPKIHILYFLFKNLIYYEY